MTTTTPTTTTAADLTPYALQEAMDMVRSDTTPMDDRVALWAALYSLQKAINRALGIRQRGQTAQGAIKHAMVAAGAERWGPIRLTWRAIDPRYECNAPGNWEDAGVQDDLAAWAGDSRYSAPDGTSWIRHIPAHYEIDTVALGAAVASGDPAARDLYQQLNEKRYRTEEGRDATLTVDEVKP